jgi:hypothetical protein
LILYRKAPTLRIKRAAAPEPPFWFGSAVAPYSARRAQPVAIDYLDLRATSSEKLEVAVCDRVRDELSRATRLREPLLIDAAEIAEAIFRRGDEANEFCVDYDLAAMTIASTRGTLPSVISDVVIAAWPVEMARLDVLFAEAKSREMRWGVVVPIVFPVTTDLVVLNAIADLAKKHGASFLAAAGVELDATAKQSLASTLALASDEYETLFHADLDPVTTATERHVAALAHERGMSDFIVPPRWQERSNWNAAVLLALTASRMQRIEYEPELALTLARAARNVAALEKPLAKIAAAASLSIVEVLDATSVEILTEWIGSGRSAFVERVNTEWRMRRGGEIEN